jgi:5'-3' exonuclease
MGISNLLKFISLRKINTWSLFYDNIYIDASCWLHKAKYAGGFDLALNPDSIYFIEFISKMIAPFDSRKLIFVFDGKTPPIKQQEHDNRRLNFKAMRENAFKDLSATNDPVKIKELKKIIIQTIQVSDLVEKVIKFLEDKNIRYVHAEYESDEYISNKATKADLVITEDSDFIPRGIENILFKYNQFTKSGFIFVRSESYIKIKSKELKISEFDNLIEFCVLCGCDYYKHSGIAIMGAWKIAANSTTLNEFKRNLTLKELEDFNKAVNEFKIKSI